MCNCEQTSSGCGVLKLHSTVDFLFQNIKSVDFKYVKFASYYVDFAHYNEVTRYKP